MLTVTFMVSSWCSQEEPYLHQYYRDLFNNLRQYSDQSKGWWALNLLASPNSGPPPTPEEVADMASYLGVDIRKEYHLMWCAKQAVQVLAGCFTPSLIPQALRPSINTSSTVCGSCSGQLCHRSCFIAAT